MAVEASAQDQLAPRYGTARQIGAAEGLAIVRGTVVTVLAEIRWTLAQQGRLNRPVGRVTDRARLLHRRVLKQEWPALFVVTIETRVVDRRGAQQIWAY